MPIETDEKEGINIFRDLCKIQQIIKFVTISDFFVNIAIFFSHFLAEITRTITSSGSNSIFVSGGSTEPLRTQ
ncbi:hypothetical protein [Nitrosomonas sp.]|uniref:hypothetical protein n=1 Tax=Nitrosomonas sp. TaxID=42353 RepID=UPI00374D548F